jgi:hypothetical protein
MYIFTLKQVTEKQKKTSLIKSYWICRLWKSVWPVNRHKLWQTLQKGDYPLHVRQVMKSAYLEIIIVLDWGLCGKLAQETDIKRGVRHWSSLPRNLFNKHINDSFRELNSHMKNNID